MDKRDERKQSLHKRPLDGSKQLIDGSNWFLVDLKWD